MPYGCRSTPTHARFHELLHSLPLLIRHNSHPVPLARPRPLARFRGALLQRRCYGRNAGGSNLPSWPTTPTAAWCSTIGFSIGGIILILTITVTIRISGIERLCRWGMRLAEWGGGGSTNGAEEEEEVEDGDGSYHRDYSVATGTCSADRLLWWCWRSCWSPALSGSTSCRHRLVAPGERWRA